MFKVTCSHFMLSIFMFCMFVLNFCCLNYNCAECRSTVCFCTECHCARCHYTEYRGPIKTPKSLIILGIICTFLFSIGTKNVDILAATGFVCAGTLCYHFLCVNALLTYCAWECFATVLYVGTLCYYFCVWMLC
jgi:hypothetical protein